MALFEIRFAPSVQKDLRKIPKDIAQKILENIRLLAKNPKPFGFRLLEGSEIAWRIKINKYRVVYTIEDKVLIITVVRVAHRKDVYR